MSLSLTMRLLTQSTSRGFDPSFQSWWVLRYSLQNLRGLLARWMVLLARFATSSKCKCNWSCHDLYHSGGSKASVACAVLSPCLFVWQISSVRYQWETKVFVGGFGAGRGGFIWTLVLPSLCQLPRLSLVLNIITSLDSSERGVSQLLAATSTCSDSSI